MDGSVDGSSPTYVNFLSSFLSKDPSSGARDDNFANSSDLLNINTFAINSDLYDNLKNILFTLPNILVQRKNATKATNAPITSSI